MTTFLTSADLLIFLAEADPYPDPLTIELSMFVYTVIAFLVLLFILTKFAWKPIAKLLDERADKIEGQIEEARRIKNLAEQRVKEYEEKIAVVHKEIEELKDAARKQGEELKQQLEQKGREEVEEMRQRASKEIDLMVNKARGELREIVAGLALEAAERITEKSLADEDHKRLAEETIMQLGGLETRR